MAKKSKKIDSLMMAIPDPGPSVEVNIYNDGDKREGKAGGSLMARENYENGGDVEGSQTLVDNWLETLKNTKDYNRKFEVPANVSAKYNYGKIKADSDFQRVQQDAEGLGILDVEPEELNQILQDVRLKQNGKRARIDAKKSTSYDGITLANIYNENDPVLNALREGYTPDIPRRDKESLETRIKTFLGFEDKEEPIEKPEPTIYTAEDMEMLRRLRDPDAMVEHANASGMAEQQGGQMANEERTKKFLGGIADELLGMTDNIKKQSQNEKKPNIVSAAPDMKSVAAMDHASTTAGQQALEQATIQPARPMMQEGGMAMPSELMPTEEAPVDTYPNVPPEEMAEVEASQLPDDEMEDGYLDFIVSESLSGQEQQYLMESLEADPQLSSIIDKLVLTASEFTGEGEVDGPGTGVSDSIPARLSDGEFVFTKKATDQLGADNLQTMMDDAERAWDGGYQKFVLGGAVSDEVLGGAVEELAPLQDEKPMYGTQRQQSEMKKQMMYANRMPSIIGVQ